MTDKRMPRTPFEFVETHHNCRFNAAYLNGKKIADIGCGKNNKYPRELEGMKFDVTYIDSRPDVEPDICCDILNGIPVPNESFDAVHTCHFMEHFMEDGWNHYPGWDNMEKVCLEIKRILKPNGDFIVIVPTPHSGMAVSPDHKSVYSISMWKGILSKYYRIMGTRGVGTWIDVPEIPGIYELFLKLAIDHPFFGSEYVIWCKK